MSSVETRPFEARWWVLEQALSIAALVPERHRCGVYILEFANGERYVGQTLDVVHRYRSHRHGSQHHTGWHDVVGIGFI